MVDPKRIATKYLKTYFIFDAVGVIPFNFILFSATGFQNGLFLHIISCSRLVRLVRLKTMMDYLKQLTAYCRITDLGHEIICLVLMTIYFVHWWACISYMVPKTSYKINNGISEKSWIYQANILPRPPTSRLTAYIESLLCAVCHFYLAGTGLYLTGVTSEQIVFTLMLTSGVIYFAYVLVIVFEIVGSANVSQSKFEEIISQLEEYMVSKQLSPHLRNRLTIYYENKFQKHYFREHAILSTLSDRFRYELLTYCTKRLIDQIELFKGLSANVIDDLTSFLKQDVYLPNDVICTAGTVTEYMHFIVNGTVALISPNGTEINHLHDGQHFGEAALLIKRMNLLHPLTCVSVEITECLRIEKEDLWHLIKAHADFARRMFRMAQDQYQIINRLIREVEKMENASRDLLHELRHGKIVTRRRRRTPMETK